MIKFFKSVITEMKQVTWPTYRQNLRDTRTVIIGSLSFAIFLGVLDWLFQWIAGNWL